MKDNLERPDFQVLSQVINLRLLMMLGVISCIWSNRLNAQLFQSGKIPVLTSENQKSFGTAWVDYDNDNDLDLFIVNMGDHNSLYENNGKGAFEKKTSAQVGSLVEDGGQSFTMSWADYNNDGRLDVFVGNFGEPSFLYIQEANHHFKRTHQNLLGQHAGAVQASSWVDFDLDGDLDLFLATKEQPNLLFENDGKGGFEISNALEITRAITNSHGIAWTDINNDNYPDLFLAENSEDNNLFYLSNKENLTRQAHEDSKSVSIGASWVDYDNDLDMDLFVTNALAKNDYLYENPGNGKFKLVSNSPLTMAKSNSMGACWGDFDNDGDQDVFVANSGNQVNGFFENMGEGQFSQVTGTVFEEKTNSSRGCSAGDYDNDGDLDIYVTNGFGNTDQNEFYENNGNNFGWVKFRLIGVKTAIPIGTRITLKTANGSNRQMREISSQTGAYGHNSYEVHFGIGTASEIQKLIIRWPNGELQQFENLDVNTIYTLKEGNKTLRHSKK